MGIQVIITGLLNFQFSNNMWKLDVNFFYSVHQFGVQHRTTRPKFRCYAVLILLAYWITKLTLGDVINPTQIIENPSYTLKKINYHFRSRIDIKARNYSNFIEMNQHGNNFIDFWLKKINSKIKLLNWYAFRKFNLLSNWQRQFDVWPWIAEG